MGVNIHRGTIVHSLSLGDVQMVQDAAVVVGQDGSILSVHDLAKPGAEDSLLAAAWPGGAEIFYHQGKLLLPGFVDGHAHAPQYAYTGTGMDLSLLQWLEVHTFPVEAKFSDLTFARKVYEASVSRHLQGGATTCSYFGTVHLEATKVLVDVIRARGQRAHVGKVCMDRNAPDYYIETTEDSIQDTEAFARYVLGLGEGGDIQPRAAAGPAGPAGGGGGVPFVPSSPPPLVTPVVTPRFVPTCTPELMEGLRHISDRYQLPVQSHMSESLAEIAWVKELYPECDTYAAVYEKFGLMHRRAYFAHCIHSCKEERDLVASTNAGVVHCASSNFMLSSGVCNVRRMLNEGIKVGLGTDVAGGYSPSMLDCIRQTLVASRVSCMGVKHDEGGEGGEPLSFHEAFHLATQGGAEVLGLGNVVGNFLPGKQFDALVVDPSPGGMEEEGRVTFNIFPELGEGMQEVFEKFLFLGDDRNIASIFVGGKKVV